MHAHPYLGAYMGWWAALARQKKLSWSAYREREGGEREVWEGEG
jgi:hypothetical protein